MRYCLALFLMFLPFVSWTQTPQAINYQAVARDAGGQILPNKSLTVRLSIKTNGPAGTTVYQETHAVFTNTHGLFSLLIGQGNPVVGTFANLNWGQESHFLKVEVDDGTGYLDMGTTQFVAVPYALYAEKAGSGGSTNYTAGNGIDITNNTISNTAPDQIVTLTGSGATNITGAYPNFVINSTDNNTTYNAGTGLVLNGQTFSALNQNALWNANALRGQPIAAVTPTAGQLLKWDGSQWIPDTDQTGTMLWTAQDTNIYYQGGQVAIGRTSPEASLHVAADRNILFGQGMTGEGHKWMYVPKSNAIRSGELKTGSKNLWNPDSIVSGTFGHGVNIQPRGPGSVVFGKNSVASGDYSFAAGIDARSMGLYSVAFGSKAHATGDFSFASGFETFASGNQSVAIGHLDTASGENSIAMGIASAATGDGSIALGENAKAYGGGAVALGNDVKSLAGGVAIGDKAFATNTFAIAIGKGLTASGEFAVAMGGSPTASGGWSTSIGLFTQATGFGAIAMGEGDTASGNHSVAMGLYSAATANGAVAIGRQAISRGEGVAIGSQAFALGGGDVALGSGNEARGGKSFAAGAGNIANGIGAVALGSGNVVNGAVSAAVGLGHTVNSPNALVAGFYSQGLNNVLFEIGAGTQQNPNTIFNVMDNGEVGIGNTNPDGLLHVGNGTGDALYIGSVEKIEDGGAYTLYFDTDLDPESDQGHSLGSSSNRWFRVYASGGVVTTSDAREKKEITQLDYGLDALMQLQPVAYYWKDSPDKARQIGLLAQDLQQVIPEVVVDHDIKVNEETGEMQKVPAQRLGVAYNQLIPVLVKSIQEQQATIEALQAEVEALKKALHP